MQAETCTVRRNGYRSEPPDKGDHWRATGAQCGLERAGVHLLIEERTFRKDHGGRETPGTPRNRAYPGLEKVTMVTV
jgi:hypothetical protein